MLDTKRIEEIQKILDKNFNTMSGIEDELGVIFDEIWDDYQQNKDNDRWDKLIDDIYGIDSFFLKEGTNSKDLYKVSELFRSYLRENNKIPSPGG